ncbi:hypothetical protein Glove_109g70 [Diversispora epigaea]|uniref:Uncharacterized protein n=1 Tax=Diversispora epigaea TaxID=1348612 RepID=A0A397J2D6_9GLOM|nr:hypothetical protein Glove_109g70 [Diversispora epigaea]
MSIIESFIYFKFYFRQKMIFNYDIPVLGYTMINSVFDFTYNLCISYKMYILSNTTSYRVVTSGGKINGCVN